MHTNPCWQCRHITSFWWCPHGWKETIYPFHYYRLPTKLLEGKVFSRVSQSFCLKGGVSCDIVHDAFNFTVPPLLVQVPSYGIPLYRAPAPPSSVQGPFLRFSDNGIWWSKLDTCSNLCTWGPHSTASRTPNPPMLTPGGWLRMVGKRAVRILLECILVFKSLSYSE